ncbi:MAG TPA: flagellar motor protein MotB [Dongiaceae bacterium]|nr:flagellar motor protein MotB [Dongiaceae bacterium]
MRASDSDAGDSAAHAERVAAIRQAMPQWAQLASGFKPAASRNPSLPTLVGLFILILCFFVVLTSISLRDQRREQSVMASLERTFSGEGMATPAQDDAGEQQAKRMLGNLRSKLGSEVPLVTGVAPETSDVLVLDLPRDLVFAGAGPDTAPGFTQILDQVAQALRTGPADFAYELEVAITAPVLDEKTVAAGNAVAGALRAAGFANDTAMVSLTPGKAEAIALTVRLRPDARLQPGGNP